MHEYFGRESYFATVSKKKKTRIKHVGWTLVSHLDYSSVAAPLYINCCQKQTYSTTLIRHILISQTL